MVGNIDFLIGIIFIKETKNNIYVNLSSGEGRLLLNISSGNVGMRGSNRRTTVAGKYLGKRLGDEAESCGLKFIKLRIYGPVNNIVQSVVKGFTTYALNVIEIEQVRGIPHNGVRAKKQRRL